MNEEEQGKKMAQVIAKAWLDDAFKQRLLNDPAAVLRAEGMDIPQGVEVRVVENTEKIFYFILPPRPSDAEISDQDLRKVAAGFSGDIPPPYTGKARV